jgi:SOS-response transcriptional repressor LexA
MSPVLESGWVVRVDTAKRPEPGDVTAVYILGEGGIVGYWRGGETPLLDKENPAYAPVDLTAKGRWEIWGVVVALVSAPLLPRRLRSEPQPKP